MMDTVQGFLAKASAFVNTDNNVFIILAGLVGFYILWKIFLQRGMGFLIYVVIGGAFLGAANGGVSDIGGLLDKGKGFLSSTGLF